MTSSDQLYYSQIEDSPKRGSHDQDAELERMRQLLHQEGLRREEEHLRQQQQEQQQQQQQMLMRQDTINHQALLKLQVLYYKMTLQASCKTLHDRLPYEKRISIANSLNQKSKVLKR